MTTKETKAKVIELIINTEESICKLRTGEAYAPNDLQARRNFYKPSHWTLAQLNDIYQKRVCELFREKRKAAVEAYYKTEEGATLKEYLEGQLKACAKRIKELEAMRDTYFTAAVQQAIGENWACRTSDDSVYFYMIDQNNTKIFGMDFDVRFREDLALDYDTRAVTKTRKIELNAGTMGSFEPDSTRAEFYKGFVRLMSNQKELKEWEQFSYSVKNRLEGQAKKIRLLRNELENPAAVVRAQEHEAKEV